MAITKSVETVCLHSVHVAKVLRLAERFPSLGNGSCTKKIGDPGETLSVRVGLSAVRYLRILEKRLSVIVRLGVKAERCSGILEKRC